MWLANHSFGGVLASVCFCGSNCVWSRNLKNEATEARLGLLHRINNIFFTFNISAGIYYVLVWNLKNDHYLKSLPYCYSLFMTKITFIKHVSLRYLWIRVLWETWVLSKADDLRLGVFERKILRRIYGPICEGAIWRSRYNEELYRLYDETNLVTTVRITRLRWEGYISLKGQYGD